MNEEPARPGQDGEPDLPRAGVEDAQEEIAAPLVAPTRPPAEPPRKGGGGEDPWAHRRGEPRLFALLWTIFLFGATGLTMLSVVARGFPGRETMQPAARALMMTVAAGLVLVWPLIRLSQRRDDRPVAGAVHDFVVVLVPVQAIVWPQTMWWLGRWPLEVVAALAMAFVAWGMVVGGVVALAYAVDSGLETGRAHRRDVARRSGWMAVIAVLGLGPAFLAVFTPSGADVRWWWMLSPVSAVAEITRDRSWSGISAAVRPLHWWMIAGTAIVSTPFWGYAAGLAGRTPGVAGRASPA